MLRHLSLQHFRSYARHSFDFSENTIIIGPNTAGKTNLVEAIMLLATGKSFRAQKEFEIISFDEEVGRLQADVDDDDERVALEVMLAYGSATGGRFVKRYMVNKIPKSRHTFVGFLPAVLFRPEELDIITDGPSGRREFLNEVLETVDREYRAAKILYEKALRQRNALLFSARETGVRNASQFAYWDELLITNGQILTEKREALITYINEAKKDIFTFEIEYDKSSISEERLSQYADAEIAAAMTLVGPQRDDFIVSMRNGKNIEHNMQHFASRGQQRLVILQMKLLQMQYIEEKLNRKPLLVLDDIFSELDSGHIQLVLDQVKGSQIILTTTHEEFILHMKQKATVIKLRE